MTKIDISGIDKGALLAELYNNAKVMGMGVFQAHRGPEVMSHAQGRELIAATLQGSFAHDNKMAVPSVHETRPDNVLYFDYLFGRCLKVNLSPKLDDESREFVDTWGYDRDWGEGAFERCVEAARAGQSPEAAEPVVPSEEEKADALRRSDESIKIIGGQEALDMLGKLGG